MKRIYIERASPSIVCRAHVKQPLLTGFIVLDTLFPIGRGQRELIIGDFMTGKSYLAKSICLNQRRNSRYYNPEGLGRDRIFCIYTCIGIKLIEVRRLIDFTRKNGITWYTTVDWATAGHSALTQYLIVFRTCARGEDLRDHGYNALVIYDTMSNHAIAHRQLSLAVRMSPGREAYPANTFYIHARLLERSTQLTKYLGFGSLTTLPLVETVASVTSTLVVTNLISICDGQIVLTRDLTKHQHYPAIDIYNSVSRVGVKAQIFLLKAVTPVFNKWLFRYYNYSEKIKKTRQPIENTQIHIFKQSTCMFNLTNQRRPKFFEEHVISIIASDMGLLCPIHTRASMERFMSALYKPQHRWILILLLICKYKSYNSKIRTRDLLSYISFKLAMISGLKWEN